MGYGYKETDGGLNIRKYVEANIAQMATLGFGSGRAGGGGDVSDSNSLYKKYLLV